MFCSAAAFVCACARVICTLATMPRACASEMVRPHSARCKARVQDSTGRGNFGRRPLGQLLATPPRLDSMQYGMYVRIGEYGRRSPDGCSEGCPCRAQGLGYDEQIVWICTDPKRYRVCK